MMKPANREWKSKFVAVAALVAILFAIASPAMAITWGEPDAEHTNVGAVLFDYPGYGLVQLCSGTLIRPQVFLTAAHCTAILERLQDDGIPIYINFDQNALNEPTLLLVVEVHTPPNYNITQSNPCDVGVLILDEEVTDIAPATLPDIGFLDDLKKQGKFRQGKEEADFTVVGYGGMLSWPPPYVEYEDSRRYAESEYQTLLKSWLRLSQNPATGDGGTCYGDSGGPAFWADPEKGEILVGITSWGDAPCVSTGFYYRVDTADTLDFILPYVAD